MEDRIIIDPDICNGRPTIRGTRITAQTILEFLGAGDSAEDILEEYPTLSHEDVLACIRFAPVPPFQDSVLLSPPLISLVSPS